MPRGNGAPIGGVEFVTWNGWFAARPPGAEAVYKICAVTCKDEQHLQTIVTEAQHSEQYSRRKIPGFSRRNREFHRFSPRDRRLGRENGEANQALVRKFP